MSNLKATPHILASIALLTLCATASDGATANEMLTQLVEKSRLETAPYEEVRALRDALTTAYPDSDQAAIGESVYLWYLADAPKPRQFDEMNSILASLRSKGESKWYVVNARLGLLTAYTYEDRHAEAKALAKEALQNVDESLLKQSYNELLPTMKTCFGEEGFENADADVAKWMGAFQRVANR